MSFPWAKQYQPTNGLMRFFDEKLPLPRLVYNAVGAGYPVPRNLSYMWNFGVLAGFFLVVQIVTGIILAMHYAANAQVAFATTEHIMRDVNWGWMLRYLHANGASFFFIVVYIHIFRGRFYSSYKAPREMIWLLAWSSSADDGDRLHGYVLPWGQMSFWGQGDHRVFGAIPVVGEPIQMWLLGSYAPRQRGLNRFFSLTSCCPS